MIKKLSATAALVAAALLVPGVALAEEAAKAAATGGVSWGHVSAAFAIGLAAAFGALAQGRAAAAACDGIARNPGATGQIRGMAFLALVLIESLVIYALVIAFVVQGK
ncbi:MAG TPA: ATP synthase F0 subunit C [Thermoanaerobaculia bacterium]|nr:ATP synthase F0 subunit C [Thermoanaerobaculia bacterium]